MAIWVILLGEEKIANRETRVETLHVTSLHPYPLQYWNLGNFHSDPDDIKNRGKREKFFATPEISTHPIVTSTEQVLIVDFATTPLRTDNFGLQENVTCDRFQILISEVTHFGENISTLGTGV